MLAARRFHERVDPVPAHHEGRHPLHVDHPWARAGRSGGRGRGETALHPPDELPAALLGPQRPGDGLDALEDGRQGEGREGDHLHGAPREAGDRGRHVSQGDRADLALVLGQHQVGLSALEGRGVDPIDGEPLLDQAAHVPVDRLRARSRVHLGRGQRGQDLDPAREVALVRAPHQPFPEAQLADDLGRARQEADDAHERAESTAKGSGSPLPS